jgi:SulP family sulfate permease
MPFRPVLLTCLRRGYSRETFLADLFAGLTVGLVALPLAMAFGIASIPDHVARELAAAGPGLTPPALGVYTAIVAGILISALGGSRVQIGGPTGAFIVIVYDIAARNGYQGLAVATAMAGVILVLLALLRVGAVIKFIPYPVTTGFTTGIAVIIATSQVADFLGLALVDAAGQRIAMPPDFLDKLGVIGACIGSVNPAAVAVAAGTTAVILLLRRITPRLPVPILAVAAATVASTLLELDVVTIGSRFGDLPRTLPSPHLLTFDLDLWRSLLPEAATIAMLCAIESLLSAVVADGMTGDRHRPNTELMGQGVANVGVSLFFGIPATGAIARTVTNIKSGARTPVAGIVHGISLVVFMLAAGPVLKLVPLAALAGLLMTVAWNMAEIDHFRRLLTAPRQDVAVLLSTFGLTVFVDLTVAVGAGVVLAALLFMKRMADVSDVEVVRRELTDTEPLGELDRHVDPARVPAGVEIFDVRGPFFFGVADRLMDVLGRLEKPAKVFILRMRLVPAVDATGLHALDEFVRKCQRQGTVLLLTGVQPQPRRAIAKSGLEATIGTGNLLPSIDEALERARELEAAGRPAAATPRGEP